jgi:hypothetical protein
VEVFNPEDVDRIFLQNIGTHLHDYAMSQPRRLELGAAIEYFGFEVLRMVIV